MRTLLSTHNLAAVLDLAKAAKLPHFVGVALVESGAGLEILQAALSSAIAEQSGIGLDFAISVSAAAHATHGPAWDSWRGPFTKGLRPAIAASLFLRWPDDRKTWDFVAVLSPDIDNEYWRRKWPYRTSSPDDLTFAFNKYMHVGRFSAIVQMVSYSESALSTEQGIQVLKGLIGELNTRSCRLQDVQYEVVHMIQVLQQRNDVNLMISRLLNTNSCPYSNSTPNQSPLIVSSVALRTCS